MSLPSPVDHPNAAATISSGAVTAFIVTECKRRFHVDITIDEAGMIVAGVSTAVLYFAGKKNHAQPRNEQGQFEKK